MYFQSFEYDIGAKNPMLKCFDHGTMFPDTHIKSHQIAIFMDHKLSSEPGFGPKQTCPVSQPIYLEYVSLGGGRRRTTGDDGPRRTTTGDYDEIYTFIHVFIYAYKVINLHVYMFIDLF